MQLGGKTCLITGAAGGIGRATAERFCEKGARVILVDVRTAAVDELAAELCDSGHQALSFGVNVAELEEMRSLEEWCAAKVGAIDVLVNNAGILRTGGCLTTSFEDLRAVLDVNLWGTMIASKLFAPSMVERGRGAIVNVASASGAVGFSMLTGYSTSKFGVVGFSQALRAELGNSGVSVSAICPGLVNTGIASRAGVSDEERRAIESTLEKRGVEPEAVARSIEKSVRTGDAQIFVGRDAQLMGILSRLAPKSASTLVAKFAGRAARSKKSERS